MIVKEMDKVSVLDEGHASSKTVSAELETTESRSASPSPTSPPKKKARILDQYEISITDSDGAGPRTNETSLEEFNKYLAACESGIKMPCLQFWYQNTTFRRLKVIAANVLAVPATSAPVERVFSAGGIFMRPHRARLSNKTLSNLIFAKCNIDRL